MTTLKLNTDCLSNSSSGIEKQFKNVIEALLEASEMGLNEWVFNKEDLSLEAESKDGDTMAVIEFN